MDYDLTKAVLGALEQEGVRYVIVGGIALNLWGLSRATLDLDLFIEPEAENVERLKTALRLVFNDPCIDEITAGDLLGEYPAIQYVPPDGAFSLDILTRLGEAFSYGDLESQRLPFEDITVSVASPRTLYRMKRRTVRPRDRDDAMALRRRFGLKEE